MERRSDKIRIDTGAFVKDFVQGYSHDELGEKYGVSTAQLDRLLALMLEKGYLTPEQISRNKERQATAGIGIGVDQTPFAALRARSIVLCAVLAGIAAIFCSIFIATAFLGWESEGLGAAIFQVLAYGFFALLLRGRLSSAGLKLADLVGPQTQWSEIRRYILLVFPLLLVSIAAFHLLFLPLSYLYPGFVEWWIIESAFDLLTRDSALTNILDFFIIVLIAPILEEFVFRGILLTRWSLKWNVRTGMVLSSLLFGLLHADIIGAFFTGYVLCVVYIKTKSLWVPIMIHIANNGILWMITAITMFAPETDTKMTLAELQEYWWLGPAAAIVALPWAVLFLKRHQLAADWSVPYLSLRENAQKSA